MKLTIIVLSLITFSSVQAQFVITGKVIDVSGNAIPFATVYVSKSNDGIVTNLDGKFEYRLPSIGSDTLIVSHIGFVSKRIILSNKNTNNLIITLQESIISLDEVVILPTEYLSNPKKIVNRAISKIINESDNNPFILEGFYRQMDIQDDEPKRLIEASLVIGHPGYSQPKKVKYDFEEVRRSIDLRVAENPSYYLEKDTAYLSRQVNCWYKKNVKRSASPSLNDEGRNECSSEEYGLLDASFIKEHKFKIDTISTFENELVYVIKVLPTLRSKQYMPPRGMIIPIGKLFIRADDFTLLKFEYNYILNPRKSNSADYQIYSSIFGSKIIFQINALYRDFEGISYLFYLNTRDFYAIGRKERMERKKYSDRVFDLIEREYIVNKVIKYSDQRYKTKINREWDSNLFTEKPFNESFWESFNRTIESSDQKEMRESLEKRIVEAQK